MPQIPTLPKDEFPRIYLPALDGLRGWAVLVVILGHLASGFRWNSLAMLAQYGGIGVDLFFVLSGFLITGILLDAKGRAGYLPNFYARRVLRIWPIYFLLLATVFLLGPRLGPAFAFPHSYYRWEYYVFFLQNVLLSDFGPFPLKITWSLGVEEQFYLVWPLLVLLCRPKSLRRVLLLLVCVEPLIRLALHLGGADSYILSTHTLCRSDGLALGGLLALWARSDGFDWLKLRQGGFAAALAGVTATALLIMVEPKAPAIGVAFLNSALALLFAGCLALAISLTHAQTWWGGIVNNSAMRHLGKISYGLYIYHCLIFLAFRISLLHRTIMLWNHQHVGDLTAAAIEFGLAYLVALISWQLIEGPILGLKRHFKLPAATQASNLRTASVELSSAASGS